MAPETVLLVAVVVLGVYLGHCAIWPFRRCWMCRGRTEVRRGANYRHRRPCLVCGGAPYRRLGARLLGRGR